MSIFQIIETGLISKINVTDDRFAAIDIDTKELSYRLVVYSGYEAVTCADLHTAEQWRYLIVAFDLELKSIYELRFIC